MQLSDFDFELPESQIAQAPVEPRDASRLLVLPRHEGAPTHGRFSDIVELLRPDDLLVVNDARVIPARLLGKKQGTGGRAELLLVRPYGLGAGVAPAGVLGGAVDAVDWVCLGQASKGLKAGQVIEFDGGLTASIVEPLHEGELRVRFTAADANSSLADLLETAGRLPLPPYIRRAPEGSDKERYQTVYAREPGAVAAPTAGLHFTPELLARLEEKGVRKATVTLDVGPGTFLPIRDADVEKRKLHSERFSVPAPTRELVRETRAKKGRVVAVGTTVVRTLEASTDPGTSELKDGPGDTTLFIAPGFQFRQVDALLTNFHLPQSSLVMLVSAFAGRERVLGAYKEAVSLGYRFFSYGDAMFIS